MKLEYFTRIHNPMTVIALFVGLTEVGLGVAALGIPEELQPYVV